MKSFRFPRSAIVLGILTFVMILAAIGLAAEMSRTVQSQYPGPNLPALWWARLPWAFLTTFMMFWAVGAIGYVVLFGFRRAGIHRFSNIVTWPQRRG